VAHVPPAGRGQLCSGHGRWRGKPAFHEPVHDLIPGTDDAHGGVRGAATALPTRQLDQRDEPGEPGGNRHEQRGEPSEEASPHWRVGVR
jgi:hypothetical protein